MTYRVRNIVIAVALAIAAAMLSLLYVANYKAHVRHTRAPSRLRREGRHPVGTAGADVVKHHMLGTAQVVQRTVAWDLEPDQLQRLVTTRRSTRVSRSPSPLRRPRRARSRAQLARDASRNHDRGRLGAGLAGVVKAGDHVDMVATWKYPARVDLFDEP